MRVALVTGGSGGIGSAVCRELAEQGFALLIHYIGDPSPADQLVTELRAAGTVADTYMADVSQEAQVEAMFAEIMSDKGRIDVVVNNAGITRDGLVLRMKLEDWQKVLDVNLTGAFLVSRSAAKVMLKQRSGKIINVSSVVGIGGNAGQANYAASKAGLIGFTKSLAKELAARGVTCNAVAPGFIETAMTAVLPEEVRQTFLSRIPLGRPGLPEDVAKAIGFLASPKADYITGQVLRIDGGMSI
ncbi:MAG: 3-oxoacyl-(acyl-carrier-protein) reductase [Bacillota bacterium]|nr:MAG: 3-oxoacyl-(acyl-carrier-protein) reductase [Bacillota bacterium]MBS3951022.1 3-oxoacyl-[acyl-carrier-protein] reductase [Peptococcaceae bacterium]